MSADSLQRSRTVALLLTVSLHVLLVAPTFPGAGASGDAAIRTASAMPTSIVLNWIEPAGSSAATAFAARPTVHLQPLALEPSNIELTRASSKPIYLHVAPGQEWHWQAYCRIYDACTVPVYFVTESWFVNVYLPAIGSRDGREQRYRINAARERASERESHHEPSEE